MSNYRQRLTKFKEMTQDIPPETSTTNEARNVSALSLAAKKLGHEGFAPSILIVPPNTIDDVYGDLRRFFPDLIIYICYYTKPQSKHDSANTLRRGDLEYKVFEWKANKYDHDVSSSQGPSILINLSVMLMKRSFGRLGELLCSHHTILGIIDIYAKSSSFSSGDIHRAVQLIWSMTTESRTQSVHVVGRSSLNIHPSKLRMNRS